MTLRLMHVSPEMEPVVRTFILPYSCQLPFYYTLIMLNSVFPGPTSWSASRSSP